MLQKLAKIMKEKATSCCEGTYGNGLSSNGFFATVHDTVENGMKEIQKMKKEKKSITNLYKA